MVGYMLWRVRVRRKSRRGRGTEAERTGRGVESDAVDLGELFGVAAGMGGGVRGARKGAWGLGMRTRRREGVLGGESSWLSLSKKEWSEGWCG